MAWETRRRKRYYYSKRRRGARVESHYIGAGEAAQVIATLEALYREQRTAEREQWRREQQSHRAADADIDRLGASIRLLVAAALLAAGCHTHKGQWRSRRERQDARHTPIQPAEGAETTP
jgi:predicted lysophospholipase L1 biosynthesis ABC-type transport system permease subunit